MSAPLFCDKGPELGACDAELQCAGSDPSAQLKYYAQ